LIANVSGGVVPYIYAWNTGSTSSSIVITPTSNRDYSVTVTDANGCTATEQVTLQYGTPFTVILRGNNTFCSGDSTTLCATAINPTYGATYLWQPGNNNSTCITIAPSVPTTYSLTVIDGCGATTTADVNVYPYPTPVANMGAISPDGCAPFCVQFYNASTILQSKIKQYVWDFGDGDTSHSQSPVYCYPTAGTYNVSLTVISDSGCSSTLTRKGMISVFSPPKAAFNFSPQPTSILSPTIQFTDKSADALGITYWWWTFGDATDSTSHKPNPIHTYRDTGNYCPTLVVMNTNGCTDTTTNCLIIEPVFTLYIPSAFSPNSDGLNDAFKPTGEYIRNFEMYIFDRWGMEIYHTTDINEGWNGTVHGSSAISQEDVYIYRITVTDSEGNQHSYIGNVTLLR
jgi:gliding motility-associated-like protein